MKTFVYIYLFLEWSSLSLSSMVHHTQAQSKSQPTKYNSLEKGLQFGTRGCGCGDKVKQKKSEGPGWV